MTSGAPTRGRGLTGIGVVLGAAAVAGLAAAAAPPPAALASAEAGPTFVFAALSSTAIVALAILPFMVWRSARRRPIWIAVAVGALVLGLLSFSMGVSAQRACTAHYGGKAVLVGTEWTALGAKYAQANPELASDELLFDSAGVPDRLWTRSSISRCRVLIGGTYFLWIPFLVVCVLASVQATSSATLLVGAGRGSAPPAGPGPAPAIRYDVFVSYRHGAADTAFAIHLLGALEADGYRVAIDERDFPANASFLREMERCIRESRFTVAVVSSRYLGSGNCEEEAIICKVLDMEHRTRRLIPMIIEPVAMPAWLYGIVGIDCTKPDPLVDPFDKLKATIGAPTQSR